MLHSINIVISAPLGHFASYQREETFPRHSEIGTNTWFPTGLAEMVVGVVVVDLRLKLEIIFSLKKGMCLSIEKSSTDLVEKSTKKT